MVFLHTVVLCALAQNAPVEVVAVEPAKVFAGHGATVYDVALSPDGKVLATASFDASIKLWSVEKGTELATLAGHQGKVFSVAFSADGRALLSAGEDKTVKLWDVPADGPATIAQHGAAGGGQEVAVEAFVLSADGRLLVTAASDGTVRVWNRASGAEEKRLGSGGPVRAVALDPAGQLVAWGGDDRTVRVARLAPPPAPAPQPAAGDPGAVALVNAGDVWKLFKGKSAPPGEWNQLGFDDSSWAAAASGFGYSSAPEELKTVKTALDDMRAEQFLSIFVRTGFKVAEPGAVKKLVLRVVYDDGFVAFLNGEEVARRNVEGSPPAFNAAAAAASEPMTEEVDLSGHLGKLKSGDNVLALQGHNAGVSSSDFVLTPVLEAVLAAPPAKKEEAPQPAPKTLELAGSEGTIRAVALSEDGARVAAAGDDRAVRLWQVADGKQLKTLDHGGAVAALAFSDSDTVVSAGEGGAIQVWSVERGEVARTLAGHTGAVKALAWHGGKKMLASAGEDRTLRLWSVAEGKQLREIAAHDGAVLAVAFATDGASVVSGGADGRLRAWNVADGTELAEFVQEGAVRAVGAHGDRRFHAAAQGSGVLDWRVASREAVRTFTGHGGFVHAVAFSPEGTSAASTGQDKTIRYWNLADGKELRSVNAHDSTVYCLEHSPDGSLLASAGNDRVVKLWKAADGSEFRRLEGHTEAVFCLLFSADGQSLFSGSSDSTVRRWDVNDGKQIAVYAGETGRWVTGLGLGAGGGQLISAVYGGVLVTWSLADAQIVGQRRVGPVVYGLAVSRDGGWAVTANPDNQALLLKN